MNLKKQSYARAAMSSSVIAVQRGIALSVSGSTEDFSDTNPDQQTEGFNEVNQGDF